ncbi:endonuclease/exonuclease/phosphatase family protein [Roseobacteraceae bacterium NS-SX3]
MQGFGLKLLAAAVGLLLAFSFGGALHPLGDSLAVFRLPLALALAVLALFLRPAWLAYGALMLAGAAVVSVVRFMTPAAADVPEATAATVYQKNLHYQPADRSSLIADIRAAQASVVTLQEVSAANRAVLDELKSDLPNQHFCPFTSYVGTAVLTKWPVVEGSQTCAEAGGIAAVKAQAPGGPVWLVSMHLHWPWPYEQAEQAEDLLAVLRALKGPMILAGDFNMVPWSHRFESFLEASRGAPAGPARTTLWAGAMPLAIDHVIAPGGGTAVTRPAMGSDHNGVRAQVSLQR